MGRVPREGIIGKILPSEAFPKIGCSRKAHSPLSGYRAVKNYRTPVRTHAHLRHIPPLTPRPRPTPRPFSERLMPHLDKSETVAFCLDLIRESYNNYGQRQFDYYQWLTNGIVA